MLYIICIHFLLNQWKSLKNPVEQIFNFGIRNLNIKLYNRSSNDVKKFCALLAQARNVVVLTGAGATSVPAYTAAWPDFRNFEAPDLDDSYMFENMPFLVWEFTHYRRQVILDTGPTAAQKALAQFEHRLHAESRGNVTIITHNTDGLHGLASSGRVIELHGSLFHTRCCRCGDIQHNTKQPIVPSLAGKGDPSPSMDYVQADEDSLPHCDRPSCGGRLRPHIRFIDEGPFKQALDDAENTLRGADLCLVVGCALELRPFSEYAPTLAGRGIPVAEFNIQKTEITMYFPFHFKGNCSKTLPEILNF